MGLCVCVVCVRVSSLCLCAHSGAVCNYKLQGASDAIKVGLAKKGNAAVAVERSQLVTPEGTEKKHTNTHSGSSVQFLSQPAAAAAAWAINALPQCASDCDCVCVCLSVCESNFRLCPQLKSNIKPIDRDRVSWRSEERDRERDTNTESNWIFMMCLLNALINGLNRLTHTCTYTHTLRQTQTHSHTHTWHACKSNRRTAREKMRSNCAKFYKPNPFHASVNECE